MPANQAARGQFQVMFLGEPDALRRSFAQVDRETVEFNRHVDRERRRLARFGIGLTGALLAVSKAARAVAQAAADAQISEAKLEAQAKALGISYEAHAPDIQSTIQKISQVAGLDDEDLQDAFTDLLRATGSVTESRRLLQVTADLARAKNMDLSRAARIVARVEGGNVSILRRYGVQIDKNASSVAALAALSDKFHGQAKAYGETAQGAYERFGVATENLQEAIGSKLLPAITDMVLFGVRVVERTGWIVSHIDDTVSAVSDWITATANQAMRGIFGTPGAMLDGGKWIAGRLLDGAQSQRKLIGQAADWMLHQALAAVKAVFVPKVWAGIASAIVTGIVKSLGHLLVDKLIGLLGGVEELLGHLFKDKSLGGIGLGGAYGKDQLARWLTEALLITNHFSAANLHALYGRAMQESGGNPHAINLWDSNAKAGHPSKGLLQTIDSTFNAYKLPGHGNIWDPVDNAIAAIRYMFAVYGHIVGPSGSGYAGGGDFLTSGPYRFLAGEKGPERIRIRPVQPRVITIHAPQIRSVLDAHALAHHVAFLAA